MGHGDGDLQIRFKVRSHPFFKREGYDIHTSKMLKLSQAVLGGVIDILTIYGKKKIEIAPGIQPGDAIKIQGSGVSRQYPNERSKGDHYVHFNVRVPTTLTRAQREAIQKYAACEDPIPADEEPKI